MCSLGVAEENSVKRVREPSKRQQPLGVKVTKNRLSSLARRLLQVNPHLVHHVRKRAVTSYAWKKRKRKKIWQC